MQLRSFSQCLLVRWLLQWANTTVRFRRTVACFFYTLDVPGRNAIVYTELGENGWLTPRVAPFSGTFEDYDPLFAPDGKRLYFSSVRPTEATGQPGTTGIWFVN